MNPIILPGVNTESPPSVTPLLCLLFLCVTPLLSFSTTLGIMESWNVGKMGSTIKSGVRITLLRPAKGRLWTLDFGLKNNISPPA